LHNEGDFYADQAAESYSQRSYRYFHENREEHIGNIAASGLLSFFLEEIAPSIYNKAITDVQERMQIHVSDLDIEFHEEDPLLAQVQE
jgi:uncharacterized protein (DUF2164 family)